MRSGRAERASERRLKINSVSVAERVQNNIGSIMEPSRKRTPAEL